MKRLFIALFLIAFITPIFSCVGIEIKDEQTKGVLVEMAARRLAYHVATNNPDIITPSLLFCDAFAQAKDAEVNPMIQKAVKYLAGKTGNDPMLIADLSTLTKLISVDVDLPTLDPEKHKLLIIAIGGFRNGLQMAQIK